MKRWLITMLFISASTVNASDTSFFSFLFSNDSNLAQSKQIEQAKKLLKLRLKRKELRHYAGAPPIIPHHLEKAYQDDQSCMNCHQAGSLHGPVVPHPGHVNCMQCHVLKLTGKVFVKNYFRGYFQKELDHSKIITIPPYIPHQLQNRTNCITCHLDPGAKDELVPNHGLRENCMQCHIQRQKNYSEFTRKNKEQ